MASEWVTVAAAAVGASAVLLSTHYQQVASARRESKQWIRKERVERFSEFLTAIETGLAGWDSATPDELARRRYAVILASSKAQLVASNVVAKVIRNLELAFANWSGAASLFQEGDREGPWPDVPFEELRDARQAMRGDLVMTPPPSALERWWRQAWKWLSGS